MLVASAFPTKCHLNMSGSQILLEQINLNPLKQESMIEMKLKKNTLLTTDFFFLSSEPCDAGG